MGPGLTLSNLGEYRRRLDMVDSIIVDERRGGARHLGAH